jgi:rod shape-determining protein MreC
MRNLIKFLVSNLSLFLFVILELISFYFIANNNRYYNSWTVNTVNEGVGSVYKAKNGITEYFSLGRVNDSLVQENMRLQQLMARNYTNNHSQIDSVADTLDKNIEQVYSYFAAKVIKNTTDKAKNFIYLDRGSRHGIRENMGVFNSKGIVGITTIVSPNFCIVTSVLNTDSRFSVKLSRSNYYGNLSWDTKSSQYALLSQIPNHVKVVKGDSVLTSGFSSFFPANIMVGTIQDFHEIPGSNFLELRVKLSTDFHNLSYVYIVNFLRKEELHALEVKEHEQLDH